MTELETAQNENATPQDSLTHAIEIEFEARINKFITNNEDINQDEVKHAMINAGATYNNVNKIYNALLIKKGLNLSNKDKAKRIETLCNKHDITTENGLIAAVNELEKNVKLKRNNVITSIRRWADRNNKPIYQKKYGYNAKSSTFFYQFINFIQTNPTREAADIINFILGHDTYPDTNKSTKREADKYISIYILAYELYTKSTYPHDRPTITDKN